MLESKHNKNQRAYLLGLCQKASLPAQDKVTSITCKNVAHEILISMIEK
jgi:hypothetical protein